MDEFTFDAFANRGEPLPRLTVTNAEDAGSSSDPEKGSKRERFRRALSVSKIKEIAQDYGVEKAAKLDQSLSLQDRLFAKLLQQVMPAGELDGAADGSVDPRSSKFVQRPAFSLPVMTNNFRRFNARIGIVFVFQNRLIRLFTWKEITHTVSFLSVYTFVCLDPNLLVVVPIAIVLFFIMIPAFVARHPPPPPSASTSSTTPYYSYHGPALAPPSTIRPASETSKDFFRNMRDLQNSMADFTTLHDLLVSNIAPPTNFSNEVLSSSLFLYLTLLTASLFIIANLIPWRFIFLVGGWAATIYGHPAMQDWLAKKQKEAEERAEKTKAELKSNPEASSSDYVSVFGISFPKTLTALQSTLQAFSAVRLDSAPQKREVEIFELQYRPLQQKGSTVGEWQPHLFTPAPYDPLSPARISGDRPHGTRFFEDVQPPRGWVWEGKKWELDLEPREWVAERLITGVEFDITSINAAEDEDAARMRTASEGDLLEAFGGWVWDLPPTLKNPGHDDEMWLAYNEAYDRSIAKEKASRKEKKEMFRREARLGKDWEEGRFAGRTGEWRRRRWVRVVKRVGLENTSPPVAVAAAAAATPAAAKAVSVTPSAAAAAGAKPK